MLSGLAGLVALAATPAAALAAPSATTEPATKVHHTSAVLNGKLDPDVDPSIVECAFEWGATVAYGNTVPCNEGDAFTEPTDVSTSLANLTPGTTYHFRLHIETTSSGPFNGADRSFRPDTFPITHPEITSFGPDGTSSSSFGGAYTMAFNQATRSLFVLDRKTDAIFGFDAANPPTYSPLSAYSPLAVPGLPGFLADQPDIAVDGTALPSAGNIYYVSEVNLVLQPEPPEYKIYGYSSGGAPLPGFPIKTATGVGCGAAVDSSGHLWVGNRQSTIEEFSSAGAKIGSIDVVRPGGDCKLAFDSNDDMYVVGQNSEVWKYTAASGYSSGTEIALRSNNNAAVDTSTHNVYVSHYAEPKEARFPEGTRIYEYDPAGHFLGEFAVGIEGSHVAVDATNHNVFVTGEDKKIHVFDTTQSTIVRLPTITTGRASAITGSTATLSGAVDPEGMPVTDCHIAWGPNFENTVPCDVNPGSGSGDVTVSANLSGLTPGTGYAFRVFASNAEGTNGGGVGQFTTNFPPAVRGVSPTAVTNDSADLNGLVDPKGFPTTYHFEWGPTPAYGNSAPIPDGSAGSGEGDVAVSGHIAGLSPNTRYFWRLRAESLNGASVTEGSSFLTLGPPVVETTGAPVRTTTSAQLGARVSPRGFATSYFFEYGSQGPCDANPCTQTASQAAGSGTVTGLVSEQIGGLEPNTTYHYRIVAESGQSSSPISGGDMTVTTRASEAPLSHGHFPGPPGSDRAYEQVSPPDTGGNPVGDSAGFSADGSRALYQISGGTPLSEEGNLFSIYFAQREESGPHEGNWQPKSILPPRSNEIGNLHWLLTPDASLSTVVGAVIDETTSNLKLWHLDPERAAVLLFNGNATIDSAGVSEDGSRLMGFIGIGLSDLTSGAPQLVSLLPDGSVPSCGVADVESFPFKKWKHRISADGSMAFFSSRGNNCTGPARTYIRYLDTGQSKLISPPPVSGAECDSVFVSSTPDAVFLWSKSRFSAEDTAPKTCEEGARNGDIYRYDLHDETLKCVTCVLPGVDADVYVLQSNGIWRTGESILVSEDGSRVYFQSPHALVPGAPDVKDRGSTYRVNVNTGDLAWVGGPEIGLGAEQTTATPDGSTLLFDSDRPFLNPLNGSNNSGTRQYYRYDDRDRSLVCVSCPTDGGNPRAAVRPLRGSEAQGISQLSDDGKIIAFSTPTPLLGSDQNTSGPAGSPENGLDVYEWRDGQYLLVTDGLTNSTPGTEGPTAAGMSASGRDIFFGAATQYTPDALDGYRRLYDARIDGGFIHPTAPPPCPLEVCQGTPKGAPEERAPGTGTFAGPGNLKPRRAKHKKHAKKHHRKAANKHAKHRANNNRRTAR